MKIKGYTKTTFGKLKVGDTFNCCFDFDTDNLNEPEFYKRVKTGETECGYADGTLTILPENNNGSADIVYVKSD